MQTKPEIGQKVRVQCDDFQYKEGVPETLDETGVVIEVYEMTAIVKFDNPIAVDWDERDVCESEEFQFEFITPDMRPLENKLTEVFQDNIEIDHLELVGDIYKAFIGFDGVDNKGYKGTVEFRCDLRGETVTDFELVNYTGTGYITRPVI